MSQTSRTFPPPRAVVFDLDGLMFDSEALYFRVAQEVMCERGGQFTQQMMRAMIGRRANEVIPSLMAVCDLDELGAQKLIVEARQRFYARVETTAQPSPGLLSLMDHLDERRIPRAVATSSRRDYVERILRAHDLIPRFQFLLTAEDVTRGKPEPEIYLRSAERIGVEPEAVVVLEDSPAGVAAARAAGAFAVAVPHEHSPAEGLSAAHLIVPRLDDPALLGLFVAQG